MAFTRSYAQESGDPFRFRAPKWVRKITLKKAAPWIAGAAAIAMPGLAPALLAKAGGAAKLLGAAKAIGSFGVRAARTIESAMPPPGPTSPPSGPEPPSYGGPNVYTSPSYEMEVTAPRTPRGEAMDEEPWEEEDTMDEEWGDDYEGDPDDLAEEFARGYGYVMGDARRRRRAPRGTSALATAGGSIRGKAGARRVSRQRRAARAAGANAAAQGRGPRRGGKGGAKGGGRTGPQIDWGRLAEAAASGAPIVGGLLQEGIAQARGQGRGAGAAFGGKRRRSMNPVNVKALRRSMRRVEGFQKVVKRVEKMFPKLQRARVAGVRSVRGHKPGCRCVACK